MNSANRSRLLYLSYNDGSDMRINKELQTLSKYFAVELLAIGTSRHNSFVHTLPLAQVYFIEGRRQEFISLLRYFALAAWLLLSRRYYSVHIINEPQQIALWPFLWLQKRVVLDIFDSLFLRQNKPHNQWLLLKRLVYAPASRVIVTDENRQSLLPTYLQHSCVVLPNYPHRYSGPIGKPNQEELTIMYYGWLGTNRGTTTVSGLLATGLPVRILMAGWLADEASRALITHPAVEWLGTLPQDQALRVAATRADYILCVYAPINTNNINASPNKIYDAIQTRTPVVINREVKVSEFVEVHRIGHVLSSYEVTDYEQLLQELRERRKEFKFSPELIERYTWEQVEELLLIVHR
ncbi:hypothetical protein [Telluribacter sp.]|jgi:hypothetical protein|uniref:hypothetical protein n=1 Tax=Telluribacter sp. TaxID=1978767 RepID=UPI002E11B422|nr:hypothetical protein [Telluribacter sp.]